MNKNVRGEAMVGVQAVIADESLVYENAIVTNATISSRSKIHGKVHIKFDVQDENISK